MGPSTGMQERALGPNFVYKTFLFIYLHSWRHNMNWVFQHKRRRIQAWHSKTF